MSLTRTLPRSTARLTPSTLRQLRFQSTSTSPTTPTRTSEPLTWPTYLSLRHRRRIYSNAAAIPTTLLAFVGGASYFGSLEMDPSQPVLGLDPMIVYGGATLACGGLGYLLGPTFGALLFKTFNSSKVRSIELMDKRFYEHIKSKRVDPSYQSINNPTPDYYGEKISSLPSYRRWLRDQAAYRRKALHGMKELESEGGAGALL